MDPIAGFGGSSWLEMNDQQGTAVFQVTFFPEKKQLVGGFNPFEKD